MKADVVVIGAGVAGASVTRELSRYNVEVVLIDRECDACLGASKANSAIVHAGYDDPPASLKSRLCVRGNALYPQLMKDLGASFERNGSLVVAFSKEDFETLGRLRSQGITNGVPGLRILSGEEVREREPNLSDGVKGALWAPTAGIISPYELVMALCENAIHNGVVPMFSARVEGISVKGGRVKEVHTDVGSVKTHFVINAAGLYADDIARMVGLKDFHIYPRKGEYFIFDKKVGSLVSATVFPTPTPISKGILVTHTVEGNTMIGPNAETLDVKYKYAKEKNATTRDGLEEVFGGAIKLVPDLSRAMAIKNFAGLRPEPSTGDFIIRAYDRVHGFINVAGIKSPGLTAAPAIAELAVELLRYEGLELKTNDFDPYRQAPVRFADLMREEQEELIARDPRYGHVVCRCEHVTEGEIVDAIRAGARTLDGIKYRTRCGMGRCQGAFDTPRRAAILARELGIPLEQVTKRGKGSEVVMGELKGSEGKREEVKRREKIKKG